MIVDFSIPDHAKQAIETIKYIQSNTIKIKFTEKYQNKEIISPFNSKDIGRSLERLEKKLKKIIPDLRDQDYYQVEDIICFEVLKLPQSEENRQTKKLEVIVNKYSKNRKGALHEAVIVDGEPLFVVMDENHGPDLVPSIIEKTRTLLPPSHEDYLHNPYEFRSIDEINYYIQKAENESICSLYLKAKAIGAKYIDQEEHIINQTAIGNVFSYFQDRFNTVHYTGIFGDNGTGKSSIGDLAEALAYRVMNTTDPTPANIFRSLGNVEPGQITLILDEAEKVDQIPEMIAILKSGYEFNKKVNRVNPNNGNSEKFFAFGQKMIIGERAPSNNIARGVLDRTFQNTVYAGNPAFDIKEILNPTDTGRPEYKKLYEELEDLRKTLFAFRLLHFSDPIPDIETSLSRRNKELVKPYIQLVSAGFRSKKDSSSIASAETAAITEQDKSIITEVENTFKTLVDMKNAKKEFTIESALLPIILDLAKDHFSGKKVTYSDFWNKLKENIRGYSDEKKPNEYHTEDFGIIFRNTISNIIQKLGVETKHHRNYTELLFNRNKIVKSASQYNITIQTELNLKNLKIETLGEDGERCERRSDSLDTNNQLEGSMNSTDRLALSNSDPPNLSKDDEIQNTEQMYKNENNIYRLGRTDKWYCNKCKYNGDKWFMQKHPCKGLAAS